MKNKILFLILLTVVTVASVFFILPSSIGEEMAEIIPVRIPNLFLNEFLPWRFGLDLVGGIALVYDIDITAVPSEKVESVTNGLRDVIERRINLYGVAEPRVRVIAQGERRQLLVELAGIDDVGAAVQEIGDTPFLDFGENCVIAENIMTCDPTGLSGKHIERASVATDQLGIIMPVVSLEFNEEGSKLFEEITARNVGQQVAIFLDGAPISSPVVQEKIIGGSAQISGGNMTLELAHELVERLNAGALAAPIRLASQRAVNATAAVDSLYRILLAGVISILLVIIFIIAVYKKNGIIAGVALLLYVIFSLAVFKLIPGFTMSLAGITGFILSIGAALDANILIFERTKEESRQGARGLAAVESGFKFAWSSIRDSNVSTILTALVLYLLTTGFVQGFALTLLVGILINLAMTYVVTRNLLKIFPGRATK